MKEVSLHLHYHDVRYRQNVTVYQRNRRRPLEAKIHLIHCAVLVDRATLLISIFRYDEVYSYCHNTPTHVPQATKSESMYELFIY